MVLVVWLSFDAQKQSQTESRGIGNYGLWSGVVGVNFKKLVGLMKEMECFFFSSSWVVLCMSEREQKQFRGRLEGEEGGC